MSSSSRSARDIARALWRFHALLDREQAFLAKRERAAVRRGIGDLAHVSVGHHQLDLAGLRLGDRLEIGVEADRPLRTVAARPGTGVGPDFRGLAGPGASGRPAQAGENMPLRE